MNGSTSRRRAASTALVAAGLLACCLAAGCRPASKARTAVILDVDWEKVGEVRQANLYPQHSLLEVTAILASGEEVTAKLPIDWQQAEHLKDGAKLMIQSKDKQYFDALVTIIPQ
jgi:hypothetical protein